MKHKCSPAADEPESLTSQYRKLVSACRSRHEKTNRIHHRHIQALLAYKWAGYESLEVILSCTMERRSLTDFDDCRSRH